MSSQEAVILFFCLIIFCRLFRILLQKLGRWVHVHIFQDSQIFSAGIKGALCCHLTCFQVFNVHHVDLVIDRDKSSLDARHSSPCLMLLPSAARCGFSLLKPRSHFRQWISLINILSPHRRYWLQVFIWHFLLLFQYWLLDYFLLGTISDDTAFGRLGPNDAYSRHRLDQGVLGSVNGLFAIFVSMHWFESMCPSDLCLD